MKENDYYQTPSRVVKPILLLIGQKEFSIDPCSPMVGPSIPARVHYTEKENGLIKPWGRHTFLNPPYSELEIWTEKALAESKKGNYIWAVYPLRNNVFYQEQISTTARFKIALKKRVGFFNPVTGKYDNQNREGTYIIHWGPDDKYLAKLFANKNNERALFEGELIFPTIVLGK